MPSTNFAREAEKPVLEELLIKGTVLSIAVSADTDETTLRKFAEKVRDDLLTTGCRPMPADSWTQKAVRFFANLFNGPASISQVAISGVRSYEISIEVSEETLRSYGLTLDTVANAVQGVVARSARGLGADQCGRGAHPHPVPALFGARVREDHGGHAPRRLGGHARSDRQGDRRLRGRGPDHAV